MENNFFKRQPLDESSTSTKGATFSDTAMYDSNKLLSIIIKEKLMALLPQITRILFIVWVEGGGESSITLMGGIGGQWLYLTHSAVHPTLQIVSSDITGYPISRNSSAITKHYYDVYILLVIDLWKFTQIIYQGFKT